MIISYMYISFILLMKIEYLIPPISIRDSSSVSITFLEGKAQGNYSGNAVFFFFFFCFVFLFVSLSRVLSGM